MVLILKSILIERDYSNFRVALISQHFKSKVLDTHPIVVIKLVVKESSEKRNSKQLFPTPIIKDQNNPNKLRIVRETRMKKTNPCYQ